MDRKTQKIKFYLDKYLGKTKDDIEKEWGGDKRCEDNLLIYNRTFIFFKDEIIFFFAKDVVVDVAITEYFMGIAVCNIFYYKECNPSYKTIYINRFLSVFLNTNIYP